MAERAPAKRPDEAPDGSARARAATPMIELTGAVTLTVNGESARVVGEQRRIQVDVDRPRAFLRACRPAGTTGAGGDPRHALAQAAAALSHAGLTVRVTSRARLVVTLGREARPGLPERLFALPPHVAVGSPLGLLRLLGS